MSSSVFIEKEINAPLIDSEPVNGTDKSKEKTYVDSNLVVVYGKNGVNFDRKGLESLIEEKTLSSISVLRLTSPTPSMEDAEEEAEKLEELLRRQTIESEEEDTENETESENLELYNNNDEDCSKEDTDKIKNSLERNIEEKGHFFENCSFKKGEDKKLKRANVSAQKISRKLKKERPEVVGLTLEEFYPPDVAKEIAKEILREAGVSTIKLGANYEFQISVIKNDHCYTPFTSPSQMKAKIAIEKQAAEKQPNSSRKVLIQNLNIKPLLPRKKFQLPENEEHGFSKSKGESNIKNSIQERPLKPQNHELADDYENFSSSSAEEELNDISSSEETVESDNDRDSDLDFDINNRKGRKPRPYVGKKIKRLSKVQNKRRDLSQDDSDEKSRTLQKFRGKKPMSGPNRVQPVQPSKNQIVVITETSPSQKPVSTVPLFQKKIGNPDSKLVSVMQQQLSPAIAIPRRPSIQIAKPRSIHGPEVQSPQQTIKEIVINKFVPSPKRGFTDINTLFMHANAPTQTSTPTHTKTKSTIRPQNQYGQSKGFLLLEAEAATNSQLPAQISIQTHPSSSELAAENDKQLDLIDLIVKNEMEKSGIIEKRSGSDENTAELVKMLESTEMALESNKRFSIINSNEPSHGSLTQSHSVLDPLTETPDEDIPDDLLQHVVDLIEDEKTLQEEVEKQIFGEGNTEAIEKSILPTIATSPSLPPINRPIRSSAVGESQIYRTEEPNKSIIQISISNTADTSLLSNSNTDISKSINMVRKEPIQIIRGNRVITLPPIEAPTTRAKRRAQTQDSNSSNFSESSLDTALPSSSFLATEDEVNYKDTQIYQIVKNPDSKDGSSLAFTSTIKSLKKSNENSKESAVEKILSDKNTNSTPEDSQPEDDDDPKKLWCICRQPHNNRFMICCDACEDWFHGTCVSITKAMGLEMEQKGIDWKCPKCVKKHEEKKQRKITDMLGVKKLSTAATVLNKNIEYPNEHNESNNTALQNHTQILPTSVKVSISKNPVEKQRMQSQQFITLTSADEAKKAANIILTNKIGQKKLNSDLIKTSASIQVLTQTPPSPAATNRIVFIPKMQEKPEFPNKTLSTNKTLSQQQIKIKKDSHIHNTQPTRLNKSPTTYCVFCKREARINTNYCSDDCIRKYAQTALSNYTIKLPEENILSTQSKIVADESKKKVKGLFEDLLCMADKKPKVERINVFERKSGRILTGNSAPTTLNLKKWLQENPTFEIVQPGSLQAIEIENRLKQRSMQNLLGVNKLTESPTSNAKVIQVKYVQKVDDKLILNTSPPIKTDNKHTFEQYKLQVIKQPTTPKSTQKYDQQLLVKPVKINKIEDPKLKEKAQKKQSTETKSKKQSELSNTSEEPIRLNVRRTLQDHLMSRIKEKESNTDSGKLLSPLEVEEFVRHTEAEMYNYFNRDTGSRYKAKYRSLIFNIKDRKNLTLFEKICARIIKPKQLVKMSPDELASQELAKWRENEAKHQLDIIKKSELDLLSCTKNYVLKTHKGEEVIEGKPTDCANLELTIASETNLEGIQETSVLNNSNIIIQSPHTKEHSVNTEINVSDHKPEIAQFLKSEEKAKLLKKQLEDDRARDREKKHKNKGHYKDKSKSRKRSHSRSRSRSRSRERRHKSSHKHDRRDKSDRDSGKGRSREKDRLHKDRSYKEDAEKKYVEKISSNSPFKSPQNNNKKDKYREKDLNNAKNSTVVKVESSFSLVDQILESTKTIEEAANMVSEKGTERIEECNSANSFSIKNTLHKTELSAAPTLKDCILSDSDQEPTSTVTICTPPQDPYLRYFRVHSPELNISTVASTIWSGNINMIDVTSFQIILQPVEGNSANLGKLLPEELDVVGRIGPDTVWDYISKIKKSPNKEIIIIRLIPFNESETTAYTILYQYLDKRKRLGVIKTMSPQIKDFYIFPLGAGKQMPTILKTSERVDFYEDAYRPDVLIGIVIYIVGKRASMGQPIISDGTLSNTMAYNTTKLNSSADDFSSIKRSRKVNDIESFAPSLSPKRQKVIHSSVLSNNTLDIDAIIKAPITSKIIKHGNLHSTTLVDDANEPYSPGDSSEDDGRNNASDDLKRKMEEINRKIAAQEEEIAGLLIGDKQHLAPLAANSKVLANISIPSNLSQILAGIRNNPAAPPVVAPQTAALSSTPPPPVIGSLIKSNTTNEEYIPENVNNSSFIRKEKSTTSRLAQLSEAELLSMVPDDMIEHRISKPSHPTERHRYSEPPPPGV